MIMSHQKNNIINYSICYDESEEDGLNIKLSDELSDPNYSALSSDDYAITEHNSVDSECDRLSEEKYKNISVSGNSINYYSRSNDKSKNVNISKIDIPKWTKLKNDHESKCIISDSDNGCYIKDHLKSVNIESKKRLFICSIKNCRRKFSLSASLKLHQQSHTNKRFKCKYCSCVLMDALRLKYHESKHVDENGIVKTYMCVLPNCNTMFTSRNQRNLHEINEHSDLKNFSCIICNKSFSIIDSYKFHLKAHLNNKLHSCLDCGKCFSSRNSLSIHKKIHRHRNFVCDICDSEFYSSHNYLRHINIHKVRRYNCVKCYSSYTYGSSLTRHMVKTHSVAKSDCKLSLRDLRKKNSFSFMKNILKSIVS